MDQRLSQNQTLRQELRLTQKMQQAIHILQLSTTELEQYLDEQLEVNPVLEQSANKGAEPEPKPEQDGKNSDDAGDMFDESFDLDAFASQWDMPHSEGRDMSYNPDLAERYQYYQDSITQEQSFTQKLLTQLRLAADDDREYRIGERLIGEIDEKGYFTGSTEEIAAELGEPHNEALRMLYRIQRFEPTGVGARDVVECLLLQAAVEYPDEPQLQTLIEEHLEELEHRQIPRIAKAMDVSPQRVEELKDMLATLDPWPGLEYSAPEPQYVTPDVIVEKVDDDYVVYLSNEQVPELRISPKYRALAQKKDITEDEKKFLKDKLDSAKWLIQNIAQRHQTILKVSQAIVDVQKDFFDKGIEHIKPLTLQEIADKVGVHEATVSRTTRGKYMQTPQGLFELKFFFSPGLKSAGGQAQSNKSVQSMIQKIVDEEDKSKPLSDQKIANILKDQGIKIARRTVTKYRENLGIVSASMRKHY